MAASLIEYKAKNILYIDYSGTKNQDEMIEVLHQAVEIFKKVEGRLRTLTDMTDAFMGLEYIKELKRVTPLYFEPKAHKAAIIGVNDLKSILIKGYNSGNTGDIISFNSKNEALEFLVS